LSQIKIRQIIQENIKRHKYDQLTKEREIRGSLEIMKGYHYYQFWGKYIQEY
jgi:hypothetical protein